MKVNEIDVKKPTLEKNLRILENKLPEIVTDIPSYFVIRTHLRELYSKLQNKEK